MKPHPRSLALVLGGAWVLGACASIPADRYGLDHVAIEGNEVMDDGALLACLATQERPAITIHLGQFGAPSCGSAPFEGHPIRFSLWTWPWTEWPLFDELVFDRDVERVVRWYHARGHFDARVVETRIEPAEADDSDTLDENSLCGREGDDEGCLVSIVLVIEEGEPTLVSNVELLGTESLDAELVERLREVLVLAEGERFDEALYESSKGALQALLIESSYARAEVRGEVRVDRGAYTAEVDFELVPGPSCVFGRVLVEGNEDLPSRPIREAASVEAGEPFSTSRVREVQRAVYDLGAFASVNVQPDVPDTGNTVDVRIDVVPAQRTRFQVGGGVQSGVLRRAPGDEVAEVPQWDVHLLGSWEHRNLFGGLRRFRVEERPRLIFNQGFPRPTNPDLGNLLSLEFSQPGFLEPRTRLVIGARWELGPEPFLNVFRHEVDASVRLERFFFDRKLFLSFGVTESFFLVPSETDNRSNSDNLYLEEVIRFDFRDHPVRVTSGLYATVSLQQAGYFLPSAWSYVRLAPELRGYLPLPAGIVLAMRFSVGALLLDDADPGLDALSVRLGPTSHRFRGGGATSNRGFPPGELGDGPEGGTRRWLGAAELRFPLTQDFFITTFADTGDVSQEPRFRFDHPQLSVGLGFRLLTLVGPVRLDFGWRVPGAQFSNRDERSPGGELTRVDLLLFGFPGAVNLTIGDSF